MIGTHNVNSINWIPNEAVKRTVELIAWSPHHHIGSLKQTLYVCAVCIVYRPTWKNKPITKNLRNDSNELKPCLGLDLVVTRKYYTIPWCLPFTLRAVHLAEEQPFSRGISISISIWNFKWFAKWKKQSYWFVNDYSIYKLHYFICL